MLSEYIKFWDLSTDKKSIPISHEALLAKLEILNPDRPGQETLNMLRADGLIVANIRGKYELTSKGLKIRLLYPLNAVQPQIEKTPPEEWSRFRKLLSYYIDCIHISEKSQQFLFPNQQYKDFFIPILPPNWLKNLQDDWQNQTIKIPIPSNTQLAKLKLLQRSDEDEEIYIGYPVHVIRFKKNEEERIGYAPVALVPIDIIDYSEHNIDVKLRLDEAEINQSWIEYSVSDDYREALLRGLYPKTKDSYSGLLDLKKALSIIETSTETPSQDINSDKLERILPINITQFEQKRVLYNVPVLFVGESLRYSKTLKKELIYIRDNVDDKTLDSTALAYVFREHPL